MLGKFFRSKAGGSDRQQPPRAGLVRGVDPEAKYCLRCGDEYRADMTNCAVCGDTLVTGVDKLAGLDAEAAQFAGRSMEISAADELIGARKGGVREIKELQKLLAAERIPSIISSDEKNCSKGCCGPEMYLLIRKADLEAATKVLTREYVRTTALDSHDLSFGRARQGDGRETLHCPACGCVFSETVGACPDCGLCFG